MNLTLIVLIKSQLIMCDKNQTEAAHCTRHKEARGTRKFIPRIIPGMKMTFIFLETVDKSSLILHNVLTFVAVNIHSTMFSISPTQFAEPATCGAQ